jgi:hypothetical protein
LIVGLASGDDAHFSENVARIRLLCSAPRAVFLPLVGDFVRTKVFHAAPRRADYSPQQIKFWPRIIMKAKDRTELTQGTVSFKEPGRSGIDFGFNLDKVVQQVQTGKDAHAQALQGLRSKTTLRPTRQQWAVGVLHDLQIQITTLNVASLCSALDAAYEYDNYLYNLAQKNSYDFSKHDSDWLDSQQLYYLADPNVFLVTFDSKLKQRIAGSSQADRILNFEELKVLARV